MPNQQLVADLADQLWEAGRARAPIEPLTDRHPGLEVDDGYAIQTRNIKRRVAANRLAEHGEHLAAGSLVFSGGLTAAVPIRPGHAVTAEFDGLGTVEVFA
jgi:2-keto-4-pentenoate hydratase